MKEMTHLDDDGQVRMVDVTDKSPSLRTALATGRVLMGKRTIERIQRQRIEKGNVLETARIAGVMGAKKTAELIPMCHPLNPTHIEIDFSSDDENTAVEITARVRVMGRTGVEMEALTAVSVAALTIYDMCKSLDKRMEISCIRLVEKTGGKSGSFFRDKADEKDRPATD